VPAVFRLGEDAEFRIENDLMLVNVIAYELDGVGEFQHADELRRAIAAKEEAVINVDMYSARMVLRALDHARARDLLDEDGNRLRDDLVTQFVESPSYVLKDDEGNQIREWHPTSGPYVPSERLVTAPGEMWLVVDSTQPLHDDQLGVLTVRPYPPERGM
jgi:hypothetical protein